MKAIRSLVFGCLLYGFVPASNAATSTILGWNNLGMHCMDSDYSVFSILPPYNTVEAQLIVGGRLVTDGTGYTVTYEPLADPSGSINSTSVGKGNFYTYTPFLYGTFAPDQGLVGWPMPGSVTSRGTNLFETLNQPVHGVFTPVNWFHAEGIPITPYDDAMRKNPYPLMRMIAWNSANQPIATNDVVLPVSDEMDCRVCHASGTQAAAQSAAGWVWDGLPERDYRLNILRLHDEYQFALVPALYAAALATNGYNPAGLYRRVTADGKPVLCALCHASEALQTAGFPGVPPLTAAVHSRHANVTDPVTQTTLNDSLNRSACYRCHPGSTTRCLRGAMGSAIAADGSMEMQCQSCHGNMSAVGSSSRVGWIMEPNCQACHVGTATNNPIRYTTVFDSPGHTRVPTDRTFATTLNTPPTSNPPLDLSLYRFSIGHGGLQCSACHGSTHAEFPSSHANDNLRNIRLQGHAGVMVECTACHTTMPNTITNGPHGLHPIDNNWALNHGDLFEGSPARATRAQCRLCHGTNDRGTVLSRAQGPRTLSTKFGVRNLWRGRSVSCYDCHDGVNSSNPSTHSPATVTGVSTNTLNSASVAIQLPGTDPGGNPLTFRIVSQPAHGSIAVSGNLATFTPEWGFVGNETFTFAAFNTWVDSNLATGTVGVAQGPFSLGASAYVPPTYPARWPVAFSVVPTVTNNATPVSYDWNFGDGSAHSTDQYATHTYALPGIYNWTVTSTVSTASSVNSGSIIIGDPVQITLARAPNQVTVSWPYTIADTLLEASGALGPSAQWQWVTNTPAAGPATLSVTLPTTANQYLRVRRPW